MIDTNHIKRENNSTTSGSYHISANQLSFEDTGFTSNIPTSENEINAGGQWILSDSFIKGITANPNLEETVISSIRRIERYLGRRGYAKPKIIGEIENYDDTNIVPDYRLRVIINISNVEEWTELEDRIQEIVIDSETRDAELYVVLDRKRS
jgi:hypothetical protein